MPYYPTFAFFDRNRGLEPVARSLLSALGPGSSGVGFEVAQSTEILSFDDQREALRFLERPDLRLQCLYLSGDHHDVEAWFTPSGYLAIKFWDFAPEIEDEERPTDGMKAAKRESAILLHAALCGDAGAWLSYTSSADDKYAAEVDHDDIADAVHRAMERAQYAEVAETLRHPSYFWLVTWKRATPLAAVLQRWGQPEYLRVQAGPESALVHEHESSRPFFLR